MKHVIVFLLALVLFSCKKKEHKVYVVGQIFNSKDSSAYANTNFVLYQFTSRFFNQVYTQTVPFITDSEGHFKTELDISHYGAASLCWPDQVSDNDHIAIAAYHSDKGYIDFGKVYTTR